MPDVTFLTAHMCPHSVSTDGVASFVAVTGVPSHSPFLSLRMSDTQYNCECTGHIYVECPRNDRIPECSC